MDIKAYIASGILESYVLDDLSSKERTGVIAMIAKHPEIKAELDQIEIQLEELALENAVAPNLTFKQIADQINHKNEIAADTHRSAKNPDLQLVDTSAYEHRIRRFRGFSIAASVAALLFGGLALNYFFKYQSVEGDLLAIQNQQEEYANNYNMVKDQIDVLQSEIDILDDDTFQKIKLETVNDRSESLAYVYWNLQTEDLYLSIRNLKQLADNQQYQLWTIVDGIPIDQGVFDWNDQGLIKLNNATGSVSTFAVTIEPRGGSKAPSLDDMVVAGNVATS